MTKFFEIRIEGHLDAHWQVWFDGMSVRQEEDGTTLLSGPVPDQPALYGLLRKIRDLGLTLVSVTMRNGFASQQYSNAQRTKNMNVITTQRSAALTAGLSLLVMFFAAMFANFAVVEGMLVFNDPQTTVNNILGNLPLFRLGVVAFLVVLICDVLAAWGLYAFFETTHKEIATLAGWMRLVYTGIFGASLFGLVSILRLLSDPGLMAMFEPSQLQAQVMLFFSVFDSAWAFSLVFFGVHLLLLGYLIVRLGHAPKWIGAVLLLAAFAYLADSFAKFLLGTYANYETFFLIPVVVFGVVGELSLCIWLLFKGGKGK